MKPLKWIADLLQHGLLRASFVPPRPQRELRDLTRYRSKLVEERARLVNRLQKVLEDANVKLASVATDITGVSGRAILDVRLSGERDPQVLASLARGHMRSKRDELALAVPGTLSEHHCFLLKSHLHQLDFYDTQIHELDQEIARRLGVLQESAPDHPEPSGGEAAPEGDRLAEDTPADVPVSPSAQPPSTPPRSQAQAIGILDEVTDITCTV